MLKTKFEQRPPSHQNAIDIFSEHWASKIEFVYPGLHSGPHPMFTEEDPRPRMAAANLGFVTNSLHGMRVLELGPLEGAHTYQLARLGAESILSIEANAEAYLKCLVTKEILHISRCQFLLGDCVEFLRTTAQSFDLIFCSGILYHMDDPYELIKSMSRCSDRIFVWTHYYDANAAACADRTAESVHRDGIDLIYYRQDYGDPGYGKFWGGTKKFSSWLGREQIASCFERFGYAFAIHDDPANHPGGPNIYATAMRSK